jgi:hypothetical protein
MPSLHDDSAVARTFQFISRHLPLVGVLCAISAGGRFVQTGWPSLSGAMAQVALEIVVEGARVVLALAAIGGGNPFTGVETIKQVFRTKKSDKSSPAVDVRKRLLFHWKSYAWDFAFYCGIAFALNLIIDVIVDLPAVVALTHTLGAKGSGSAELFLKNLSVIPLTIIFQVFFVTRLLNHSRNDRIAVPVGS